MSSAIKALQDQFPSTQLILRGTPEFDELNGSYLSGLESDIKPACIFLPATKEEVASFVQTVKPFVDQGNVKFAIRGAGQVPLPGAANLADGITLDLRNLTGIELKDKDIVSIGAGERGRAVAVKLGEQGLATMTSRSGLGGIGGLALEGGLSLFSSREGFICDNVVNYEIILASGEVVNANAQENSDLWIALRGGANNFGVVTRFDMRTFPQGPIWGGNVFYFEPSFAGQIEALVTEIKKPDASEQTHLMISTGYAESFGGVMCMNQIYSTEGTESPAVLRPFTAIEPQVDALNSLQTMDLVAAVTEQASSGKGPPRLAYMNTTVKADSATLQAAAKIYSSAVQTIKSTKGLICSFTLQPYPISLLKKSVMNGGNSLGLDPSDGPLVSILLLTYWQNETDDETIIRVMKDTLEKIKMEAESRKTAVDFVYMNYAFSFQDPISSYGAENKKRMQSVSKKYDPTGLFQKGVPGGFKLFV